MSIERSSERHPFDTLECVLDRFEEAWQSGCPPELGDFIGDIPEPRRLALLRELIHIDLEYRLKASEPVRVENYLQPYPDLAAERDLVIDLVVAEWEMRRRWDANLSVAEYERRFPQYFSDIVGRLAKIESSGPFGQVYCSHCNRPVPVKPVESEDRAQCPECGHAFRQVNDHSTRLTTQRSDQVAAIATTGTAEPEVGECFGNYDLLTSIGRGGMGVVYRARQRSADRIVALKVIRGDHLDAHSPDQRSKTLARFTLESQVAARLNHPNLVTVYEVGEVDGQPFFSMEFVEGSSLFEIIRNGPLVPRLAARYLESAARGVQEAHAHGILHRDLKPQNILIEARADLPRVADFGLAKLTESDSGLSVTGELFGTPPYMSPEQAIDSSRVTTLSDVYSLGATLYHALTGYPPFQGATILETLRLIVQQEPVAPRLLNSSIPVDLETVCLKAIAKEPSRRYRSAEDLADDLQRFLVGEPVAARPVKAVERMWRWCRRNQLIATMSASVATVLVVATIVSSFFAVRASRKAAEAVAAQVATLLEAPADSVPLILDQGRPFLAQWQQPLAVALANDETTAPQKIRALLALIVDDPTRAAELRRHLLTADPRDFLLIRDALAQLPSEGLVELHGIVDDGELPTTERLRALFLLAQVEPAAMDKFQRHAEFVTEALLAEVRASPRDSAVWAEVARPAKSLLTTPLMTVFQSSDRYEFDRLAATRMLADLHADSPQLLAAAIEVAEPFQFSSLIEPLRRGDVAQSQDAFRHMVQESTPPKVDPTVQGEFAKRRANAALALWHLGDRDCLWPLLHASEDLALRSYLIDRMASCGIERRAVENRLHDEPDLAARRGLYIALGMYQRVSGQERLSTATVESLKLFDVFTSDPDPGIHGAVRWLLKQLNLDDRVSEVERSLAAVRDPIHERWYVSKQGHTMVAMGPGTFSIGSPAGEPGRRASFELQHPCRILRRFAIGAFEVTQSQYARFDEAHAPAAGDTVDPLCPVSQVPWGRAAAFCNWLSREEGLSEDQFCYVPTETEGLLKPAADCLERTGYRLPTEAEWEYACRAGTHTTWFFGEAPELLREYAWWIRTSTDGFKRPVGQKRPNEFGLFDMYGNAAEWCHDQFSAVPAGQTTVDVGGPPWHADPRRFCVLRGLAAGDVPLPRSALRERGPYDNYTPVPAIGFRVARTILTE